MRSSSTNSRRWRGQPIDFIAAPPQSLPGFLRGFFAGVEFPMACTRLEGSDLFVAQRPRAAVARRHRLAHEQEGHLRSCAGRARARDVQGPDRESSPETTRAALQLQQLVLAAPGRTSEQMILDLMKKFQDNMTKPHGASFDTFAIDMGWSDLKTLWEINKPMFPDGFANIKAQAGAMNSRLGMWISPTSCYPPALDNEWAKSQGYETYLTGADGKFRACCLGGPKLRRSLQKIALWRWRQSKACATSNSTVTGSTARNRTTAINRDPIRRRPSARGGVRAFEAVRAAVPDVWLEPTCFGANPSPWWLYYVKLRSRALSATTTRLRAARAPSTAKA